jgi:acetyl-CoA carboxylase biotin carboxyl carrier protein
VSSKASQDNSTRGHASEASDDWLATASELVREVLRSDVREFEFRRGGFRLRIRRLAAVGPDHRRVASPPLEVGTSLVAIKAPLTGVFYGGPSPGAARYVRAGEQVSIGMVVGIIEAMKVFNEVLADVSGTVAQLVAVEGGLVRAGEELILVDPGLGTSPERSLRE